MWPLDNLPYLGSREEFHSRKWFPSYRNHPRNDLCRYQHGSLTFRTKFGVRDILVLGKFKGFRVNFLEGQARDRKSVKTWLQEHYEGVRDKTSAVSEHSWSLFSYFAQVEMPKNIAENQRHQPCIGPNCHLDAFRCSNVLSRTPLIWLGHLRLPPREIPRATTEEVDTERFERKNGRETIWSGIPPYQLPV